MKRPPANADFTERVEALRVLAEQSGRLSYTKPTCIRCKDRGFVELVHKGETVAVPCPLGCS